jgi:hypothetical protein
MKALLLVVVFCLFSRCDAQAGRDNIIRGITRIGLGDKVDVVQGGRGWLVKSLSSKDEIANYIKENPRSFRKEFGAISYMFHGTSEGYRQIAHPSMHFVYYKRIQTWSVHFDIWCPLVKKPLTIAKHVGLEVIPHAIFRTRTSQSKIKNLLDKQDD